MKKEERADPPEQGFVKAEDSLLQALLNPEGMTKKKMLEIPEIASCIQKLSGDVARLPVQLFKINENGEIEQQSDDKRLYLLNTDTGDTLTPVEFWKNLIEDYYLGKGGFAYIRKDRGEFVGLYHVQEEKVAVIPTVDPIFKNYTIQVEGKTYFPYEFLKLRRMCRDGASGTPLHQEKPLIFEIAYQTMIFEKTLVQKGGNKKGFIEAQSKLSEPAIKSIKEAWRNLYSNSTDNIVILNEGAKFKESSNTSVEMQLQEGKENHDSSISKLFGFSSRILNGGATEADRKEYLNALIDLLNTIESALNKDLLLEKEKGSFYFAFDTRELTRGDIKERFEAYEIALRNNFYQLDEVREMEDKEPLGFNMLRLGLDDVLMDLQTKTVYTPNMNTVTDLNKLRGGEVQNANRD